MRSQYTSSENVRTDNVKVVISFLELNLRLTIIISDGGEHSN